MSKPDIKELLPAAERIAKLAGAEIMKHYGSAAIYTKDDGSNVTDADHAAENIILSALQKLTPLIPIVSEERVSAGEKPDISGGTFWTVDPLDGTHEFIKKSGWFVVAMALIVDNKTVMGIIYHPAHDLLYSGSGIGTASKIEADGTRTALTSTTGLTRRALMSGWRSETKRIESFLTHQYGKEALDIDSSSGIFRACRIAEGIADIAAVYTDRPQGRIAFWDVAAGHAIVESAGGRVETWEGKPLLYDAADFYTQPYLALSPAMAKGFRTKL